MDHVNKVTTYFNQHMKATIHRLEKEANIGVTQDRFLRLKHDVPTRWHSRLGSMLNYFVQIDHIAEVTKELGISCDDVPPM